LTCIDINQQFAYTGATSPLTRPLASDFSTKNLLKRQSVRPDRFLETCQVWIQKASG